MSKGGSQNCTGKGYHSAAEAAPASAAKAAPEAIALVINL